MFEIIVLAFVLSSPPDSLRMEVINGKPFVVHQVDEKETLYSLSKRYGTTILEILDQNPTSDGGLEVGQILKIPYYPKPKAKPPVQTAGGLVHKVEPKETLFSIARTYNVSVDDLKSWNNLKDGNLNIGQELIVRKKVVAAATPSPVSPKTHTVAVKETLFSISRQYGMTVDQLKAWNGLSGNDLRIGQVLTVVAPSAMTAAVQDATSQPPATVKISEGVSGTEEVKETGIAELIAGTEGDRKYLAQHRTIKPGTILKIRNLTTNQEVFVRVIGPIVTSGPETMICISKSAYSRLGASEPKFRAEITYYK